MFGCAQFDTPSGDIATQGITLLLIRIVSVEQRLQAGEEMLKVQKHDLLCRLSAADERVQTASTFVEASLKRQSALEQEVASHRDQLSAAVSTSTVEVKSKLALFCEKWQPPTTRSVSYVPRCRRPQPDES